MSSIDWCKIDPQISSGPADLYFKIMNCTLHIVFRNQTRDALRSAALASTMLTFRFNFTISLTCTFSIFLKIGLRLPLFLFSSFAFDIDRADYVWWSIPSSSRFRSTSQSLISSMKLERLKFTTHVSMYLEDFAKISSICKIFLNISSIFS